MNLQKPSEANDLLQKGKRTYGVNLIRTLFWTPRSLWIPGFLSQGECLALHYWAQKVPAGGHILEVGSWKGKSAYCLAKGCRKDVELTLVDPLDGRGESSSQFTYQQHMNGSLLEQLERNLSSVRRSRRIRIFRGTTADLPATTQSIHLLFLDGDHSEQGVRKDLQNLLPFLRPGALLLFHDCAPWSISAGPRIVAGEWVRHGMMEPIEQKDSIMVARFLGSKTKSPVT